MREVVDVDHRYKSIDNINPPFSVMARLARGPPYHSAPACPADLRDLIRRMSYANPLWGAPKIHGELLKLGIAVSQATVSKYMLRPPRPPSQAWCTFFEESRQASHRLGFLHGADGDLSSAVRARDADAQPAPAGAFQRDGASDGGMDGAATAGGLRARRGAKVSDPGPRSGLWRKIFSSGQELGYPR